jgi:hypothetical protein
MSSESEDLVKLAALRFPQAESNYKKAYILNHNDGGFFDFGKQKGKQKTITCYDI